VAAVNGTHILAHPIRAKDCALTAQKLNFP
jgi:hypothetical protein